MEVKRYLSTLWRWSWLIVLATALAAGVSYRSASRIPRVYQSTTTLLVGHTLQTTNPNPGDIETSQTLAQSYVQLVSSQPVLQATIDALHLNMPWYDLAPEVNGTVLSGTETIQIKVVDRNPQRAKAIADEVARQLILESPTPREGDPQREFTNQQMQVLEGQIKDTQGQIAELQKQADQTTSAQTLQDLRNQISVLQQRVAGWQNTYAKLSDFYQGSHTNYLSVIQPAVVPTAPVGTSTTYNVALSGGLGFALALAGIVIVEFLDDTIKSDKEAADVLGKPILGGIGPVKRIRQPEDQLFTVTAPASPAAEAFRYLGTNVHAVSAATGTVLLVTSPGPLEGKTTVAANLAIALAHRGQRVILVDANLRRPSLHRLFNVPNRDGLSTLLDDGTLPITPALRSTTVPNLQILASGPLPVNPGDLIGSPLMQARLAQLRGSADTVIVDTPAILGAAETSMLGAICDTLLLVVQTRRTRRPAARQVREALRLLGVQIGGVVLNRHELGRRTYQGYYAIAANTSATIQVPQCPFLGLSGDPASVILAPSVKHRCHASGQPGKIDLAHQQGFCLSKNHGACPRINQANTAARRTSADQTNPLTAQ